MTKFGRFELRTTDAEGAKKFYRSVLGLDRAVVWPLHEQALARGAKPHWIGYVGVADVEGMVARLVERGATRLGPAPAAGEGGRAVVLRDPGGALVALSTPPPADEEPTVKVFWHVLNTNDAARAMTNYGELFGWSPTARVDVGPEGAVQEFAWQAGGESVGAIRDVAAHPGVHPHWLFFFEVRALEPTMEAARGAGATVLSPITLPGGTRVCVCDDPQGAAFALLQRQA